MVTTAPFNAPFPGSYDPADCLFLLKPIAIAPTPIADKERLIQSGLRHYSEMISAEAAPGDAYTALFLELTARYQARLAQDILTLAELIRRRRPEPITVVSLARAGTPIGALLQRVLTGRLGVASRHYSISIIRDRGLDERALAYLLRHERRPPAGIVFVDGWTAKGVISRELKQAIARWNRTQPERLSPELFVVSDIAGAADAAASVEDYVIPSGIMNSTVSGLVSRSILNAQLERNDFHGCVVYEHLRPHDRSRWFLEVVSAAVAAQLPAPPPAPDPPERRIAIRAYLDRLQRAHGINNINYLKPGVLEASRVLLRRIPSLLLLKDDSCPDVAHLRLLAAEKGVPIRYDPDMPFNATALIKDVRGGLD